jgi:hypothetical protein
VQGGVLHQKGEAKHDTFNDWYSLVVARLGCRVMAHWNSWVKEPEEIAWLMLKAVSKVVKLLEHRANGHGSHSHFSLTLCHLPASISSVMVCHASSWYFKPALEGGQPTGAQSHGPWFRLNLLIHSVSFMCFPFFSSQSHPSWWHCQLQKAHEWYRVDKQYRAYHSPGSLSLVHGVPCIIMITYF